MPRARPLGCCLRHAGSAAALWPDCDANPCPSTSTGSIFSICSRPHEVASSSGDARTHVCLGIADAAHSLPASSGMSAQHANRGDTGLRIAKWTHPIGFPKVAPPGLAAVGAALKHRGARQRILSITLYTSITAMATQRITMVAPFSPL